MLKPMGNGPCTEDFNHSPNQEERTVEVNRRTLTDNSWKCAAAGDPVTKRKAQVRQFNVSLLDYLNSAIQVFTNASIPL